VVLFVGFVWFVGFVRPGSEGFAAEIPSVLRGPTLDAHNCYPEDGAWSDRLTRALGTKSAQIGIEQDLVWKPGPNGGVSMVAHDEKLTGNEPTLEDYFFKTVSPIAEAALTANAKDTWPIIVLHFDFKTNEPEHHRFVLQLLTKYRRWLTTAPRTSGDAVQQMTLGPVLVLTEAGDGQERDFYETLPVGERMLIFGTVPPVPLTTSDDRETQWNAAITATPDTLLPTGATNYRRWANFGWSVVERGGQKHAGAWDAADLTRLKSIVDRGHRLGLWMRFYTLDGYGAGGNLGWSDSYNFGSPDAVRERWRAAVGAGVDLIATNQYEEFARARTAIHSHGKPEGGGVAFVAMRAFVAAAAVILSISVAAETAPRNPEPQQPTAAVEAAMKQYNAALGVDCTHCHVAGDWKDATRPQFAIAKNMAQMVQVLNAGPLADSQGVRCMTCHGGQIRPARIDPASWMKVRDTQWPASLAAAPDNLKLSMSVETASLGVDCSFCHDPSDWKSQAKPTFATTGRMNDMFEIFPKYMPATARTQCFMCHKGHQKPD
jgi:hypothetical protein